jgi:hypothetical protein
VTQWFTLEYDLLTRGHIKLVNLQAAGCDDVERAQSALNSTNFKRTPQSRHYSQWEIDLIRAPNIDVLDRGASVVPDTTPSLG